MAVAAPNCDISATAGLLKLRLDIVGRLRPLVADAVVVVPIAMRAQAAYSRNGTPKDKPKRTWTGSCCIRSAKTSPMTGAPKALDSDAIGVDLDNTAATYLVL